MRPYVITRSVVFSLPSEYVVNAGSTTQIRLPIQQLELPCELLHHDVRMALEDAGILKTHELEALEEAIDAAFSELVAFRMLKRVVTLKSIED